MNRVIIYPSAIPQDTDLLLTNKHTMIALGYLMQAILGTSTAVDGLACTPTGPAGMTVNVSGGSIYSLAQIDATSYGSIAADTTDQIIKQGIVIATQNFSCPAPVTSGQSVVYLIEAAFQEVDGGSMVLPYYNSSNPTVPYSGPSNSGTPNFTVRQGVCTVQIKTGVAATTGTQTTPAPDAGFTGLYSITVANGQTTIISGNIVQLASAPFIGTKLPAILAAVQAGSASFAHDTSGSSNTITIALNPAVSALTDGMRVFIKVANAITGATVINTNGLGNVSVVTKEGNALSAGALIANGIYLFVYDANGTRWQVENPSGNIIFSGAAASTGTANAQIVATTSPTGFVDVTGNILCFQAGFTNTGSCSLNIDSQGAAIVYKNFGGDVALLTGGELQVGCAYVIYVTQGGTYVLINPTLVFDGTNFQQNSSGQLEFGSAPVLPTTSTATTQTGSDSSTKVATTAFVAGTFAKLASPALTGSPTAPTQTVGDSSTKLATTSFVMAAVAVPSILIVTPLGIGSFVGGDRASHSYTPGQTEAGANITVISIGSAATGDSLSGTWQALQSTSDAGGSTFFQRIA
jgi:hypothetical protein